MKHLYLIGGTMGVGKTTAGKCLKAMLERSVFLDGDWCWDMNPFSGNAGDKENGSGKYLLSSAEFFVLPGT